MTASRRKPPPPVVATNVPKEPGPEIPIVAAPPAASAAASDLASEAATYVASTQAPEQAQPQAAQGPVRLTAADLMRGRPRDPDKDIEQSGVRLPRYLMDAVRYTVMRSKGELTQQEVIREAVKNFLPPELVEEAWREHGGT